MSSRSGSILLFCIALVSALAVLAYGFVRVAQLHRATADSGDLRLLAQEAALAGVQHAAEQIVRDFVDETGTTPFTTFDGPAMRAFSTHDLPGMMENTSDAEIAGTRDGARGVNRDDMPPTDAFDRLQLSYYQPNDGEDPLPSGHLVNTGRGRFYEPEVSNRANPTATEPTVPVRFSDPIAGTPDRFAGIYFDDRLCRIDGDPAIARARARYRLRYAVVTVDLEGQILVNGDPGVDATRFINADPRTIADPALARMMRNMHRLPAIVDAWEGFSKRVPNNKFLSGNASAGVAAEHVFLGRGATNNVDRRRDRGSAPLTFTHMYRTGSAAKWDPGSASPDGAWPGANLYATSPATGAVGGNEEIASTTGPFVHMLVGPQHSFVNWLHATYGGGTEGVNDRGNATLDRYTPFGRGISEATGGETLSRFRAKTDTPWSVNLMTVSPRTFYAMVAGYMPPGGIALRYSRWANAPDGWTLEQIDDASDGIPDNLHQTGTTTLRLRAGSGAILPGFRLGIAGDPGTYRVIAAVKKAHWDPARNALGEQYYEVTIATGLTQPNDSAPVDGTPDTYLDGAPVTATTPGVHYGLTRTRDLFVQQLSPAFRYQAPQRLADGINPVIQPDYHVDDFWRLPAASTNTVYRGPSDRYPGPLAFNGYDPDRVHSPGSETDMEGHWLHDTLGKYLRARNTTAKDSSQRWVPEPLRGAGASESSTHPRGSFWPEIIHANRDTIPPTCMDTMTASIPEKPAMVAPHPESIWEAIGQAMAATASTVQAQWFRYPTCVNDETVRRFPDQWFNGGPWTGTKVQSIRDVDALFVANLGSNFARPNDPTPVEVWFGKTGTPGLLSAVPSWNLAGLRTAKASDVATGYDLCALNDPAEPDYQPTGTTVLLPTRFANEAEEYAYAGGDPTSNTHSATERTQAAELIINDVRLSFFGSSPQYGDDFRVLDLNGDGKAACSGFASSAAATIREAALGIDQFTLSVDADGVATVPVDTVFSNTGSFILAKSRFWRVMVRGEVWDNVTKTTISRAQLDTVLCVDPVDAAQELGPVSTQDPGGGQYSTHVIHQTWVHSEQRDFLPRRY